jgi:hypothetical protein
MKLSALLVYRTPGGPEGHIMSRGLLHPRSWVHRVPFVWLIAPFFMVVSTDRCWG